jgi:hypothetical protein
MALRQLAEAAFFFAFIFAILKKPQNAALKFS